MMNTKTSINVANQTNTDEIGTTKNELRLTVVLYPQETGDYTIVCPEIHMGTCGETVEEAMQMMREVIEDYLDHPDEYPHSKQELIEIYNRGNKIISEIRI